MGTLSINSTTGEIDVSASDPGEYQITRTVTNSNGSLSSTATDIVTINPADNAAFSYSGSPFDINNASNPTPTVTGLSGGTFSSVRDSFIFDGVDDYVQSSVVTSINSLSLWFKPNSTITTAANGGVLISFGTTDFRRAVYLGSNFGSINNELITVGDHNSNYSYYAQPGGTIDTNWHHLAVIHDGSKYQIYLDGSAVTTSGSTPLYSSQQLIIGARGRTDSGAPADSYFNGKISNVAIWNSNQTTNVPNIYNNGFPQTTYTVTPQQWWKLGGNSTFSSGTWTIPTALTIPTINYTTALKFVGASVNSDYISVPSSLPPSGTSNFALSGWFYRDSNSSTASVYFDKVSGTNFLVREAGLSGHIEIFANGTNYNYSSLSTYNTANAWHHIVISYDGSNLTVYVDTNKLSQSATGLNISSTSDMRIGARAGNQNDSFFKGFISNVAVYNTNLTDSNVSTLYNNGQPQVTIFGSPQAWYKLDSTTITDYSGNGNTGTNNGTTQVTSNVYTGNIPVNGVSTTLPSTALNSLDINSTTGLISLSNSSVGTFPVTYNTTGATGSICPATSTQSVQLVNTNFNFPTNICSADSTPQCPTNFISGQGGTFTNSPAGLNYNSDNCIIGSSSNVGTYSITYTIGTNSTIKTDHVNITNEIVPSTTTNTSTLSFNGTDSYIYADGSNLPTGNSSFTTSCWFKRNGVQANYAGILSWGTASQRENVYINFASGGTSLKFGFYSDDLASSGYYATSDNVWYNVVLVYDGSVAKMYINGSLEASHTPGGVLNISSSHPLIIGKTNTYYFKGEIDEVAVWNKAITSCDVAGIHQASSNGITADLSTVYPSNLKYYNRMGD